MLSDLPAESKHEDHADWARGLGPAVPPLPYTGHCEHKDFSAQLTAHEQKCVFPSSLCLSFQLQTPAFLFGVYCSFMRWRHRLLREVKGWTRMKDTLPPTLCLLSSDLIECMWRLPLLVTGLEIVSLCRVHGGPVYTPQVESTQYRADTQGRHYDDGIDQACVNSSGWRFFYPVSSIFIQLTWMGRNLPAVTSWTSRVCYVETECTGCGPRRHMHHVPTQYNILCFTVIS